MPEVSKEFRFEAAHRLPHLPEGHKCRNLHGHGYRFEVFCCGDVDERGFVVDYAEIKAAVDPLVKKLDHAYLCGPSDPIGVYAQGMGLRVVYFQQHTSAENLAKWIYDELLNTVIGPVLHKIRLYETASTSVAYPAQ